MKSCLHDFWIWAVRREKRGGKNLIEMPVFPEISFTLEWRNRTDIQTLEAILDEINSCMLSIPLHLLLFR